MKFDNDWDILAKHLGYLTEKEMLTDLYDKRKLSISEIARRCEVGTATIGRRLELSGITRRKRGGSNNPGRQINKIRLSDPRLVLIGPLDMVAGLLGVSRSLLYKMRKGDFNGILHPITNRGAGQIQHSEPAPSSPTTANGAPGVRQILPPEEGRG